MNTLIHHAKRAYERVQELKLLSYAAQLSYGLMLAFLPILMLLTWAINTFLQTSSLTSELASFTQTYLPKQMSQLIDNSLKTEVIPGTITFQSIAGNIALIFFVFYAAARLMHTMMIITTNLLDMKEDRSFIKLWLLSFRDLFLALVLISVTLYLYVESRIILVDFLNTLHASALASFLEWLYNQFVYLYLFIVIFSTLTWMLATMPAERFTFRQAIPGSLSIIAGFILLALGVRYYNKIMSYEGVIVVVDQGMTIIITVYFISLIILIGELINYHLLKRRELGGGRK